MKVAVVIVTYNRLELLKECVESIKNQTYPLDIFIINNGSTDNTAEWLQAQSGIKIITQSNQGSSGGQYTGLKTAYNEGYDWVWCMDDDTIPEKNALEALVKRIESEKAGSLGFVSSKVIWKDGNLAKMNLPEYKNLATNELKSSSFVSLCISKEAIKEVGLPIKEIFIWFDDVEYTLRISNKFKCLQVNESVVLHKTPSNHTSGLDEISDNNMFKYMYFIRNYIYMRRINFRKQNPIKNFIFGILFLLKAWFYILKNCKNKWGCTKQFFSKIIEGIFFKPSPYTI